MSDPGFDIPPLDPGVARLLSAERARPGLSVAAHADLLRGLEGALGLPPSMLAGESAPSAPQPSSDAPAAPVSGAPNAAGATEAAASAGAGALGARVAALAIVAFVAGSIAGAAGARWPSLPDLASRGISSVRVGATEVAFESLRASAHDEPHGEAPVAFDTLPSTAPEGSPTHARPPAAPADAQSRQPASGVQSAPAAGSAAPPPAVDGARDARLAAERRLLDIARTAVGRGKSGAALEALARHASEFPRGRLAEERDALRVQALLAAGRGGEAGASAEAFRRTYPRSMLLRALDEGPGGKP
jgi:hypothetical protein